MANQRLRVSPSINFTERDFTFTPQRRFGLTSLMVLGEFEYGPAFENTKVSSYNEFTAKFGTLNPCKFKNTRQLKFQGAYHAKQFLTESSELYVCRVLGLSGYDAGDLWTISMGGGIDMDTVVESYREDFTGQITYVNGALTDAIFSNSDLQELYAQGVLDSDNLGGPYLSTGDTVAYAETGGYISACDGTFKGASFVSTVTGVDETFICISGTTTTGDVVLQSSVTDTCFIEFGVGTQTFNSTLQITVLESMVIVDQVNSNIELVSGGVVVIKGGTITHNDDDSITVQNGVITLPNGDVLNGIQYKICELGSNLVAYDCHGITGTGYTTVTGQTIINTPIVISESNVTEFQVPSGIVTVFLSGNTIVSEATALAAYENIPVIGFRSTASYDSNENLVFEVKDTNLLIEPIVPGTTIKPYDDFKLKGVDKDNKEFEFILSFDSNKSNFVGRVFGVLANCCDRNLPLYIAEHYQSTLDNLVAQGNVYCVKPETCHETNLWNYKNEYLSAETPYVVSELRGNSVSRLFKFITISDGNAANTFIKTSITNIRPDKRTFDVLIRAFYDTDKNPVILEQFSSVTMDKQSNNYIGRLIGGTEGYPQKSMYVSVEIPNDCLYDAFPSGFEGYPVADYTCTLLPVVQYKTEYLPTERIRNEYLGFNSDYGIDESLLQWHGKPVDDTVVFSSTTNGFHLDSLAGTASVDGIGVKTFDVGVSEFKNESSLTGTEYEKVYSRKFTLAFYGGFDGWDIHRLNTGNRSNGDEYALNGTKGILGLQSGAFDIAVITDAEGTANNKLNSDYYAYFKGIRTISNPEEVKFNLLVTPNINTLDNSDLVEETIEMLETERCDAFYIIDTPTADVEGVALTPQTISDRLDGLFATSFAATYAYDGVYNDTENNLSLTVPASVDMPRVYAISDRVGKLWYAPAGKNRGNTAYINVIRNPTAIDRDVLYEGRINSLWRDAGVVTSWGNKTLQGANTALDNINVRRLLIHIRQLISDVSLNLLFEQNDEVVRRQFEALVNPLLANLRTERGISDFRIVLDSSAESFDRGELNGKICIKPIRALEFINIGFCLKNTGAEFDDI